MYYIGPQADLLLWRPIFATVPILYVLYYVVRYTKMEYLISLAKLMVKILKSKARKIIFIYYFINNIIGVPTLLFIIIMRIIINLYTISIHTIIL